MDEWFAMIVSVSSNSMFGWVRLGNCRIKYVYLVSRPPYRYVNSRKKSMRMLGMYFAFNDDRYKVQNTPQQDWNGTR